MKLKNIFTLVVNDFASAFSNKSVYLVFFIPMFIFVALRLVDKTSSQAIHVKFVLMRDAVYPPRILKALEAATENVEIAWVENEPEGLSLLQENKADAVVERNSSDDLALLVSQKESPRTLSAVQALANLQKTTQKTEVSWIASIRSLRNGSLQKQTLPTWILMMVLLVGFLILPAQVAEEKEKKLLLAMLQTPISETSWLGAKILTGILLALASVIFLLLLSQDLPENLFLTVGFMAVASYSFCAFGVFLGFLCRNQSGARTLGLLFYLPLVVPAALSDYSAKMNGLLPLLPSYQFYESLPRLLFEQGGSLPTPGPWLYLFVMGLVFSGASYWLVKIRWLL